MTPDLNEDSSNSNSTTATSSSTSAATSTTASLRASALATASEAAMNMVGNNLKRKNVDDDELRAVGAKTKPIVSTNLITKRTTRSTSAAATATVSSSNNQSSTSKYSLRNTSNKSKANKKVDNEQEIKINSLNDSKLSPSSPLSSPSSCMSNSNSQEDLYTESWLNTFKDWNDKTKLNALEKIIELCDHIHIKHVHNYIEPKLQRDYISNLPRELILHLLTYIRPNDLFKLAQVSHYWNEIANDPILWKNICRKYQILLNQYQEEFGDEVDICKETNDDKKQLATNDTAQDSSTTNTTTTTNDSNKSKTHSFITYFKSFNSYKRAYLIDFNITRNWCTRPLPRPIMLKSHDDHVITCLKFDGIHVISGSDDSTLKVWCARTGNLLHTLVGHSGGVWASQLKDNIVISGSTDRTVRVWNIETGECIHVLTGHTSTVRCLALNGHIVVSGSRDSLLRVWNIETGQCMQILRGHGAAVRCVCFDGKLVVSGSYDYSIRVWDPFKNECLHVLEAHTNRVYSLLFDGERIVSGSLDTTIIVWNAHTGSIVHKLTGHHSLTSGMQIKGDILVSGNADSTVKIWSLKSGECLHTLSGCNKHMSAVTCLAFNEKFVVSSSDDGTVKLWNLETGEFIRNLLVLESGGRGGVVWRISMHKNKLVCAVGSRIGVEDTKLILLDFDWPPSSLTNDAKFAASGACSTSSATSSSTNSTSSSSSNSNVIPVNISRLMNQFLNRNNINSSN